MTRGRLGAVLSAIALALAAQATLAQDAAADIGYEGPRWFTPGVFSPSGQKPQSKLWYHDGSWWGSLFVPADPASAGEYRIHRLDAQSHVWTDTGTRLDDRNSTEADVLWDGTHLYVASASDASGVPEIRLYRFSYNGCTRAYGLDSGFPVSVGADPGPVEAVVLAKDTTGRLWTTFTKEGTEDGKVYVAHSGSSDSEWIAPYSLPFPEAENIAADDISAIVSFEGKVGVMWSNQSDEAIYFATHPDGAADTAWTLEDPALEGPFSSDDHLNLKSLQADPAGRVFAAVKTSLGDAPMPSGSDAQVLLLVLEDNDQWAQHTFGTVADDHTRPIVLTDQRRRKLYVFATSPTFNTGEQAIYYKETSLDNPSFASGLGQPFIQSSAGDDINNASSTKQDLGNAPGLVVLAADDADYWHNMLALDGAGLPVGCPSGNGSPPPGGQQPPRDRTRPVLSRVSLRPVAFRVPRGTRVRFTLSERARVAFRVERRVAARRGRGARFVRLRGGFSVVRSAGRRAVRFSGRLRRRALRPGRYRLVLVATDAAGNRSRAKRVGFRVKR